MRFVIYKNSVLATICSMFGAAFIAMAVMTLISGELGIFSGIGVIAAGLGFMWLGDFISTKKAERKLKKMWQTAAANASASAASYAPQHQTARGRHEIVLLQPDGGKFAYHMEVTNQRILFYRESAASKNAGMVARMGGGLVGAIIAEGVKAASGSGPKPWLEIPLAAVSHCGVQNKKEFFIVADQTYVLRNKSYDNLLPDMVANAKK